MDPHSNDCPIDLDELLLALPLPPDTDREVFRVAFDCGHLYSRLRRTSAAPDPGLIAKNFRMWQDARAAATVRAARDAGESDGAAAE